MGNSALLLSGDVDFMVKGLFSYNCFGNEVWITTTHVCTLIVMLILIGFAICANRAIKKAEVDEAPGTFLNIVELLIDFLDGVINSTMGKNAAKFVNYLCTLFLFIFLSNISGILGLRPPTADYGVTFPLGVLTFTLITVCKFKYQKPIGVLKGLCDPWPFWLPINLIGDFAVPISLSLRLFANVLSGTVMMALVYGLLKVIAYAWPAVLHVYFDMFSGAIQTYVFCMLTMTYISDAVGEEVKA